MARAVGIDLGSHRIGIAVSDALGLTAQPHATLPRHGGQRDLDAIAAIVKTFNAEVLVLGLPLDPEGNEGTAAKAARVFGDRLRAALGIKVELVDESFSTVEAEDVLLAADVSRAKRKQVIDQLAAAVILRRWLDEVARRAPGSPGQEPP
jgi:putative Holliday junction resolvase